MNINYLHAETAYYFYTLLGFVFMWWDKLDRKMEIKKPKELPRYRNWFPESGNIECDCGEIIHISSSIKQHDEKLCKKCNLMYEYWNNSDGSGLRFNVKGYFPFYPEGYKYTIGRGSAK